MFPSSPPTQIILNTDISSDSVRSDSDPATVTESRGVFYGVTGSVLRGSGEKVSGVLHVHQCPRDELETTDSVVGCSGVSWPRRTLEQCDLGGPDQSPVRDYSLQTASTGESNINKQFAQLDFSDT